MILLLTNWILWGEEKEACSHISRAGFDIMIAAPPCAMTQPPTERVAQKHFDRTGPGRIAVVTVNMPGGRSPILMMPRP